MCSELAEKFYILDNHGDNEVTMYTHMREVNRES
jgi:hypothetical protein